MNHPTIEILFIRVESGALITDLQMQVLFEQPNLKHLTIIGTFEQVKQAYNKIKFDCKILKTLKLISTSGSDINVTFEFPENPSEWNFCKIRDVNLLIRKQFKKT